MANDRISFHVQHTAKPEHIEKILLTISEGELFDADYIYSHLLEENYSIQRNSGVTRSINLCCKLGLFSDVDNHLYKLTNRGISCRKLAMFRREVFYDVMHYLLFSSWEMGGHKDYWSWSYAKTCELFWLSKPIINDRGSMFGQLASEAGDSFPNLSPVVGTETIGAVVNWLRELDPPFLIIEDDKVISSKERKWFSIELALLSISYIYKTKMIKIGSPILLEKNTIDLIETLCLTTDATINSMLDIASKTYPFLKFHSGEWGNSLILEQSVDISLFS